MRETQVVEFPPRVRNAVGQMAASLNATGTLIHGSCVNQKEDEYSDVDVIYCVKRGSILKDYISIDEIKVDFVCATAAALERKLTVVPPFNNNRYLTALVDGVIVEDSSGSLTALVETANLIWRQGPPAPTDEERATLLAELAKFHDCAIRMVRRRSGAPLEDPLVRMRLSQIFNGLILRYNRLHRVWGRSLSGNLDRLALSNPELYSLCEGFLTASSIEDALPPLLGMIAVCNHLPGATPK